MTEQAMASSVLQKALAALQRVELWLAIQYEPMPSPIFVPACFADDQRRSRQPSSDDPTPRDHSTRNQRPALPPLAPDEQFTSGVKSQGNRAERLQEV